MSISNEQIEKVVALKKAGKSHRLISNEVSISPSTVCELLKKYYYNTDEYKNKCAMEKVNLYDDLYEILQMNREGKTNVEIAEYFGVGVKVISGFLNRKTQQEFWEDFDKKPMVSGSKDTIVKRTKMDGNRFVFTSAQNNTYVHKEFLKALETFCERNGAQLIVGTFNYNKNGFQNGPSSETWFDKSIRKYILNEPKIIADGLLWCGELDILPTAVNPLSGFHSYTQESSGIVPHAKVQLESLPTTKYKDARHLYTTGAITLQNYIPQKAGQKAAFHHVFGATLVEVDEDGDWFARQLIAESGTGNFYDLDTYYMSTGEVVDNQIVEAINWGDIHAAKLDNVVAYASWLRDDSMLDVLRPKYQFVHDVYDMAYRNHHNIKDPYFRFEQFTNGQESVKSEVILTTKVIESMMRDFTNIVVVESNHDLALERWLKEQDYKTDPVNSIFFLEMQLATYKALEAGKPFHVFQHACRQVNDNMNEVLFLGTDESFVLCNIEFGAHGHNGNSGARGSTRAFQMLGLRHNIGHQHSCGIKDGVYVAGVSGEMDMGYNKGGSAWSHSHIITYENGKRTIVTIKNGKWRA